MNPNSNQPPSRIDLPVKLHCDSCTNTTVDLIRGGVACSLVRDPGVFEVILLNGLSAKLAPRARGMQNPHKVAACNDFDADISVLALGVRAEGLLRTMGITTIQALLLKSPTELLRDQSFGLISLEETKQALADRGLALIPDGPRPIVYQSKPGER